METPLGTDHWTRPTFAISRVRCERDHPRSSVCTYQVAWSINPHMRPGAAVWRRACAQHRGLVRALRGAGASLVELPFVHGAFDSVFAKDDAVLVGGPGGPRALLAHPRHAERRGEQVQRARSLARRGFDVVGPPAAHLEGGDVVVLPGGRGALLGVGARSEPGAARALEAFLDAPVTPLALRDPLLYHLDLALAVLSDGTALACEEALAPGALEALARVDGVGRVVPVARADALRFALNLVEVGGTVVMGGEAPRVAAVLRALGRRVVHVPLDEFHLAGGSAACLVARVHPPAPALAEVLGVPA